MSTVYLANTHTHTSTVTVCSFHIDIYGNKKKPYFVPSLTFQQILLNDTKALVDFNHSSNKCCLSVIHTTVQSKSIDFFELLKFTEDKSK